ncbi:MAG: hypothetical protein RIQ97_2228 [Pseudomonadota bacterium]
MTPAAPPLLADDRGDEESGSQALKVQLRLREMILAGELPAGTRLTELALVQRLGASRTPIRTALMRLEQEGLLTPWRSGGYAVQQFSEDDVADAIELRGSIEGLAARHLAERGVDEAALVQARALLGPIDAVLRRRALDDAAFGQYVRHNHAFHAWLHGCARSAFMRRELDRVMRMPFASPSAFVLVQANSPQARDMLIVAQHQHWQVLDAIAQREGQRAEALLREHSRLAQHNLREALRGQPHLPGVGLIHPRPAAAAQPA